MKRTLTINLGNILEEKSPHGFHVPADIDILNFLEFNDDDWCHDLQLDAILEAESMVALLWSVDDVLARRPDLDEEKAWKVLVEARDDFQREKCHLDFIESTANGLYPLASARLELTQRIEALLKIVELLPDTGLSLPHDVNRITNQLKELEKSLSEQEARHD